MKCVDCGVETGGADRCFSCVLKKYPHKMQPLFPEMYEKGDQEVKP
jgi:hypothetical protein